MIWTVSNSQVFNLAFGEVIDGPFDVVKMEMLPW
jgi:hypothetical protein